MTSTGLVLSDPLLDAQLMRAVGSAPYGGADIGEAITAARTISGADLDSWYDAWVALGDRVAALAHRAEADGHLETARLAHWRASSYYRTAGVMLMGPGPDPRWTESIHRQRDAFLAGAALMADPPELLAIPYEGTTLPGYFFRASGDTDPRATVILTGGYDGTAEELYFYNAAAALARGYHVLAFDGPGQGVALADQGLVLRPDWENVVGPVLDYLLTRADVDGDRVALIGASLGAHLAPRAASAEHRLAACIADCGVFDMYQGFLQRLPAPLRSGFADGNREAVAAMRVMLDETAKKPTAGWSLRRGLQVHGVDTPLDYIEAAKPYSLAGRAADVRCPTFVCNGEHDDISASAPDLVAELTCEHEFVTFTAAEGAGDHCESMARTLFHARAFDWLDQVLAR
jgi:alpha-beta hydrolase superfamily lysophospholipase